MTNKFFLTWAVLVMLSVASTWALRLVNHPPLVSARRAVIMHRNQRLYSSTNPTGSTPIKPKKKRDENKDKFVGLLKEIRGIITTPGIIGYSVTRSIQVAKAFATIAGDFAKHREKFLDDKGSISTPKSLRRLFEVLGATYIKLGQFIASSPTIFPAEYVEVFQSCLDRTPPVRYEAIRKIIEEDLKKPITDIFASVDPVPLATASIAQVHRAVLKDGTSVVIKVRKPGVDTTLQADLAFLLVASKLIEFIAPSVSYLSLANIVADIRDSMLDELDFSKEIGNLDNFRSFLTSNGIYDTVAPKPYKEFSGTKVLTMEYLKGVPLVDLEGIRKYTARPEASLISALRTWALTVAMNDRFHADVHAGNLLVLEDGKIGFIDFGIVGTISASFRNSIEKLFQSFVKDDFAGIAEALVSMGATKTDVNIEKFAKELAEVVQSISSLQPEVVIGNSVDAQLDVDEKETTKIVLRIVEVAEKNGLKLPREFGLVLKQALYFDRYQKLLAPNMDPLRDVRVREKLVTELSAPQVNL